MVFEVTESNITYFPCINRHLTSNRKGLKLLNKQLFMIFLILLCGKIKLRLKIKLPIHKWHCSSFQKKHCSYFHNINICSYYLFCYVICRLKRLGIECLRKVFLHRRIDHMELESHPKIFSTLSDLFCWEEVSCSTTDM